MKRKKIEKENLKYKRIYMKEESQEDCPSWW
jgi:hypothetical protein